MKAVPGFENERENLIDSLFTRIRGLGSNLRGKPEIKYCEEDWLKERIVFPVKRTVDKYVFIEPRVRTRHLLFLCFRKFCY